MGSAASGGSRSSFAIKSVSAAIVIMMCTAGLCIAAASDDSEAATTSGTCGVDLTWSLDTSTGHLTITGTGGMTNYTADSQRWGGNTVKSVSFPEGMTSIGNYAFYRTGLESAVSIPDSVTSIGNNAFSYCKDMKGVSMGSGLNTIGAAAFSYCDSLSSVTMPNSVTSIGIGAFMFCTSLFKLSISSNITSIGYYTFAFCCGLKSVSIPNSVTTIGDSAFIYCYSMTDVIIGSGVTTIGNDAFSYCSALKSVSIPNSVTTIGNDAFSHCSSLSSVNIGSGVTTINDYAFTSCNKITAFLVNGSNGNYSSADGVLFNKTKSVLIQYPAGKTETSYTIPDTVITVSHDAFGYNGSIKEVTIPDSVTSIGGGAFSDCCSLTTVNIGSGVTTIGNSAFRSCPKITAFKVTDSNASYSSADGVLFDKLKATLFYYPAGKTETSYTIPDTVTEIGPNAFTRCYSLTEVKIGSGVTTIGDNAFSYCSALKSISIPNDVTEIGGAAFTYCTNLKEVTIGEGLTVIEPETFSYCVSLEKITIPDGITTIGARAFSNCYSLKEAIIGSGVTDIGGEAFKSCSKMTSFTVDKSNTAFTALDGVLFDKDKTVLVQYPMGREGSTYEVPDTVVTIADSAFRDCTNLYSVKISGSVATIGADAFTDCARMETFSVSGSNTHYCTDDGVLFSKDKATLIKYPSGRTGDSYTVPDTVTTIGDGAFNGCVGLYSVKLSDSVTTIGGGAFTTSNIRTMHLPANVTTIGDMAFALCMNLESFSVSGLNGSFCTVDGILYSKDKTMFVHCPAKYSGTVKIPGQTNLTDAYYGLIGCTGVTGLEVEPGSMLLDNGGALTYAGMALLFHPNNGETDYTVACNIISVFPLSFCGADLEHFGVEMGSTVYTSKDGCLCSRNGDILNMCPSGRRAAEITPDVKWIETAAFTGDKLEEVVFKTGANTFVMGSSFINCTSLKRIVIEEGADVQFALDSIVFTDGGEHTIHVVAPEGYVLDTSSFDSNIKIVYGDTQDNQAALWLIIGAVAVAAVALTGAVLFLISRRNKNEGGKE